MPQRGLVGQRATATGVLYILLDDETIYYRRVEYDGDHGAEDPRRARTDDSGRTVGPPAVTLIYLRRMTGRGSPFALAART